MCHVHVSIHCTVSSYYFHYILIHTLVLSLYSPPPPQGDPTDDQLSDEPIIDPVAGYDETPTEE